MPKETLKAIVEFIDERNDWWNNQVRATKTEIGEEGLTAWLNFARTTGPTDMFMSVFALDRFVYLVDSHSIEWLNSDDNNMAAALLAAARLRACGIYLQEETKMSPVEYKAAVNEHHAASLKMRI